MSEVNVWHTQGQQPMISNFDDLWANNGFTFWSGWKKMKRHQIHDVWKLYEIKISMSTKFY